MQTYFSDMTTVAPRIAETLRRAHVLTDAQIADVLKLQKETGGSITGIITSNNYVAEDKFLSGLAEALNVPMVRVHEQQIPPEVLEIIPNKAVFQYKVVPLSVKDGVLQVVTADPFRPGLVDALRLASGKRIRFALCAEADIDKAIRQFYGVGGETIERMMQDDRIEVAPDLDHLEKADLGELDEEASVMKFVNQIIWQAYEDQATDIHFEPMEKDLRIRYRVDGMLVQTPVPPQLKRFQSAILTRIKVMANMDIAEKRLPQDGRIGLRIRGTDIDIRVSTMPTTYGESVSLRLLMNNANLLNLGKLGLVPEDEELVNKLINRPHGIILVTGPTGSGKSTTLYASLRTINTIDQRIITTEDPIEYEMPGINQVQIKPEIGLNFAMTLRHILRQDPDVIMIGEIRDKETAEIAIQAALTGHLVFSTLHTNDAASGFTRLLDMGIEPFLVASSIEAMIAQRLVRRLCPKCKRPRNLEQDFLRSVGFPSEKYKEGQLWEAAGCENCRGSGYRGRLGIYEILTVTDRIRPLINNRETASRIKNEALKAGMRTLRDDGWAKCLAGLTTIEEVVRAAEEDEEEVS
jgi:type II secretion system protein E